MSTKLNLLTFLLLSSLALADIGTWTDPNSGAKYDWTKLKRPDSNPWVLADNADFLIGESLVFNFGADLKDQCAPGSVIEVTDLFGGAVEECMTAGLHEQVTVKPLSRMDPNRGVRVTYGGGAECQDYTLDRIVQRSTTFRLHCNQDSNRPDDENFKFFRGNDEFNYCDLHLSMRTKYGCPVSYAAYLNLSWGWILLIAGVTLTAAYLIIGFFYNKFYNEKEGIEALPHFETWADFFGLVSEGIQYSSRGFKKIFKRGTSEEGFEVL